MFVVLGLGEVSLAQVRYKKMRFAEHGNKLVVFTRFTELFDRKAYDRLASGFVSVVVLRAYVYRKGRDAPVSFVVAKYRVVYDLWDEVYIVRIHTPNGHRNRKYKTRADALKAIASLRWFPIASLSQIPRGPHHFLGLVIELNPISGETLAEIRRWLTRPVGTAGLDRSSSFFGSFVSVFVNPKLPVADRVMRLRSQPFYRP